MLALGGGGDAGGGPIAGIAVVFCAGRVGQR